MMIGYVGLIRSQQNQERSDFETNFGLRAASALGISLIADALDYVGAPIFAMPVIGDISDVIVAGLLYRITKSKVSVVINAIEFIPFIGDFIPTYTISTVLWILNELRKRNKHDHHRAHDRTTTITIEPKSVSTEASGNNQNETLQTKIMRARAILRSKMK